MQNDQPNLRKFVKRATQAATVAFSAGIASAAAPEEEKSGPAETIPIRAPGTTGLKLPLPGFGGAALSSAWLNPLSREDRVKLVQYAYDRGVRYFDTSPVHMESEVILGEALKDRRRQVCMVTKVESTKPEEVRKSVEQSLKAPRTEYLDIILIDGTPGREPMSVAQAMKIQAELARRLRDRAKER